MSGDIVKKVFSHVSQLHAVCLPFFATCGNISALQEEPTAGLPGPSIDRKVFCQGLSQLA